MPKRHSSALGRKLTPNLGISPAVMRTSPSLPLRVAAGRGTLPLHPAKLWFFFAEYRYAIKSNQNDAKKTTDLEETSTLEKRALLNIFLCLLVPLGVTFGAFFAALKFRCVLWFSGRCPTLIGLRTSFSQLASATMAGPKKHTHFIGCSDGF